MKISGDIWIRSSHSDSRRLNIELSADSASGTNEAEVKVYDPDSAADSFYGDIHIDEVRELRDLLNHIIKTIAGDTDGQDG